MPRAQRHILRDWEVWVATSWERAGRVTPDMVVVDKAREELMMDS